MINKTNICVSSWMRRFSLRVGLRMNASANPWFLSGEEEVDGLF